MESEPAHTSNPQESVGSIIFVTAQLGRKAAETQMILLAVALRARGHRVAIALLHGGGAAAADVEDQGIEVLHIYRYRWHSNPCKSLRLIRGVRTFAPDIVHTHSPCHFARMRLLAPLIRPARAVHNFAIESPVTGREEFISALIHRTRTGKRVDVDAQGVDISCGEQVIRFLLLISGLGGGGAERQLLLLARELTAMGHDVTIAVFHSGGQHFDAAKKLGIKIVVLRHRTGLDLISLASLLWKRPYDVAYSFLTESNAKLAVVRWVKPSTRIVWGVRASELKLAHYGLRSRLAWNAARVLSRIPDMIIANSHSGATYHISKGYPRGRTRVVHNGIDTNVFRPDVDAGKQFRKDYEIPLDAIVVGIVGRYDPVKGHRDFLKIVSLLRADFPHLVPLMVGIQGEAASIELHAEAKAQGVDNLLILGPTREPEFALNAMNVLVVPSSSEGFPNVVAEALACRVPVAAYDVGDTAQMVSGMFPVARPSDVETLSVLVSQAIRDGWPGGICGQVEFDWTPRRMAENTILHIFGGGSGRQ